MKIHGVVIVEFETLVHLFLTEILEHEFSRVTENLITEREIDLLALSPSLVIKFINYNEQTGEFELCFAFREGQEEEGREGGDEEEEEAES